MVAIYGDVAIYGCTPRKCKDGHIMDGHVAIYVGSLVRKYLERLFIIDGHMVMCRGVLAIYGQLPCVSCTLTETFPI